MKQKINIPEPCSVKWNDMSPIDNTKRHCLSCQTPVVDFTKKSLAEIHDFFSKHENIHVCGRYNERHTSHSSAFQNKLNRIEHFFTRFRMQKLALMLIGAILVLSSCQRQIRGRKTTGALFLVPKKDMNKAQHIKRV